MNKLIVLSALVIIGFSTCISKPQASSNSLPVKSQQKSKNLRIRSMRSRLFLAITAGTVNAMGSRTSNETALAIDYTGASNAFAIRNRYSNNYLCVTSMRKVMAKSLRMNQALKNNKCLFNHASPTTILGFAKKFSYYQSEYNASWYLGVTRQHKLMAVPISHIEGNGNKLKFSEIVKFTSDPVLYGNCESLLCNPSCTVVNLLDNIRERCGYRELKTELDLTDETGLVLELTDHKSDDALKYLTLKAEYILVEKKVTRIESKDSSDGTSPQQEITYVPLVNGVNEKYPDYATRVAQRSSETPKHSKNRKGKTKGKK